MSSGSESDEDFVPGEPEQLSEEESADEETDQQYQKELEQKTVKRKIATNKKSKKKRKFVKTSKDVEEQEDTRTEESLLNPEEDKKKEDDLWAKFLEGTDTKTTKPNSTVTSSTATCPSANKDKTTTEKNNEENKEREKRIFEFAGETIVVENNVIKDKLPSNSADVVAATKNLPVTPRGRSSGGLASFVGKLNKKNTLSTLEKSKLDWDTYKQQEGVEEEIQNHNKGKHGYLDRQDFLERADLKQYELERDLRMNKRSNR